MLFLGISESIHKPNFEEISESTD